MKLQIFCLAFPVLVSCWFSMCKFTRSTLNNIAHARCQTARARTSKHCVFACLSLCDPAIKVWVRVLANSPVLRNIPRMWWCTRKNSGKKYLIFTNFLSITSITTFFCQWKHVQRKTLENENVKHVFIDFIFKNASCVFNIRSIFTDLISFNLFLMARSFCWCLRP